MAGLRVAVQSPRNLPDAFCEAWRRPGHRARNFWQHPLRHWCHRLGHNRKQLTGGHSNQWQKVFRSFFFGFGFGGELPEMLHHRVGIDFADGADFFFHLHFVFVLVLVLVFMFVLEFFFAEQTPDHVADGAEPTLTFEANFFLELVLHFLFHLELVLVFWMGF